MKKIKRGAAVILASAMALSLAACGNDDKDDATTQAKATESATSDATTAAPTTEAGTTEAPAPAKADASIDFEDGNFAFTAIKTGADKSNLSVADFAGSKALKAENVDGKNMFVAINVDALLGDNVANLASIQMDIGTESADGQFYSSSGFIYSYTGDDNSEVKGKAWSVYLDTANPKTVTFDVSGAGFVAGIYDIIRNSGVQIVGQVVLDIEHALLGLPDAHISDIRKVYSHPQGLMQCKDFIDEHGFQAESLSNTALAARRVKDKGDIREAAIASERAAELYGLKILARRINFQNDNSTKFVIVTAKKIFLSTSDKISISFTLQHKVGSLYEILGRINENGVNMTSIESRPSLRKKWEYVFYVSFEGKLTDKNVRKALGEIHAEAREMNLLGTF